MNKKTQDSAPDATQQTQEQHTAPDASGTPVKKKAGRPAKPKTAENAVSNEPVAIFGRKRPVKKAATTVAKKAGRPKAAKPAAVAGAEKKRPGRPKAEKPAVAAVAGAEKKRPGRPKAEKPAVAAVAGAEKKRPGRPKAEKPAAVAGAEKKRPGRPKAEKPASDHKKSAGRKKQSGKSGGQDSSKAEAVQPIMQRPEIFPIYYHLEKKISKMERKLKKTLKTLDRLKKSIQS